jgi:transposase
LNSDKKSVAELETKVIRLESLIEKSLDKIDDLTHRKDSLNSSFSPLKCKNRPSKTKILRANQGKKVVGQPGHKGSTLEMIENPDIIIEHKPEFYNHCGDDLSDQPATFILRRQVVDIPPIIPEFSEHRIFQKTCAYGHHTKALFPSGVNSPIRYGSNI